MARLISPSLGSGDPPAKLLFHLLSFEGPDPYSQAGGISSRVSGLARCLAARGFETHLWFIGDPALPGHEVRDGVQLHRWCQWISAHHPGGVYDGEEGKRLDYVSSLPPFLADGLIPVLARGEQAVIAAEEWQTADALLHLDFLLRRAGARSRATILWNANNTFGFDRIDWTRLAEAATITTVSRYMAHRMRNRGIPAIAIPNGLAPEAYQPAEPEAVRAFRSRLSSQTVLAKVARWDPDKRWLGTVEIVAALKERGARPLLLARGGVEAHGGEVLAAAHARGLHVVERPLPAPGVEGLLAALDGVRGIDVLSLRSPLDADARRVLYRGADAVLANSAHEPFGLVGLETMAVGGLACTGCSGEDYAVSGHNALVVQTDDASEFVGLFERLQSRPAEARAMRRAGHETARRYAWEEVVRGALLPRVELPPAASRGRPHPIRNAV